MINNIHQDNQFRNLRMIELVNEPLQGSKQTDSMRQGYYPEAWKVSRLYFSIISLQPDN